MRGVLWAVVLLLAFTVSANPEPTDTQAVKDYGTGLRGPGAACLELAYQEYAQVISDPDNRADHYYLAATYEALGRARLDC